MSDLFDHENLRVYQASVRFVAWLENQGMEGQRKISADDVSGSNSSLNRSSVDGKRCSQDIAHAMAI